MMKSRLLTLLFVLLTISLAAQGNYYDAVLNLSGNDLLFGLRSLISSNTNSNYTGARAYLFQDLDNTAGTVTCIYTGYVFDVGYDYNGTTNPNTEHTYPQSWFSSPQSSIKKADLHHLFTCDALVNNYRGNYPLYPVANQNTATMYYSYTPWQSYRGASTLGPTVFEAADEAKGRVARALLYFYVRYNDPLIQQNVDMLPELINWHENDPPTALEVQRNQHVQNYQGNRNPFVDHPEFVGRIWRPTANDDYTQAPGLSLQFTGVYPNPFGSVTRIGISSKESAPAQLAIYDIKGRKVKQQSLSLTAGDNEIVFDGKDKAGDALAAGVYLVHLSSRGNSVSCRIVRY